MKDKFFIMLVGLPASGKSTYAKGIEENGIFAHGNTLDFSVFSSDEYRKKLFGNENSQDNNDLVFTTMHNDIIKAMNNNENIVYDACNISAKRRKEYLKSLKKYKEYIFMCRVFATPYEECQRRNIKRKNSIPSKVIKKMYINFEVPFYNEGWDNIQIYQNYPIKNLTINNFFDSIVDYEQDTPYHTFTLDKHLKSCAEEFKNKDKILYYSALLHDCGKPFTKTFINSKGEKTEIAHYYNHENVSAYNALFMLINEHISKYDILLICNIIQYHMRLYENMTDKTLDRFKNLIGEQIYNYVTILHEADMKAH